MKGENVDFRARRQFLNRRFKLVRGTLDTSAHYEDFDDFWIPFTWAVGPSGQHLAKLTAEQQEAIREECRRLLGDPAGPFDLDARAWYARGVVPAG